MPKVVRLPRHVPAAPDDLSPAAREEWDRVAPALFARGLLGPETVNMLASYCDTLALVREYDATMRKEGRTITTPSGVSKPHPLAGARQRAFGTATTLAARLGLLKGVPTRRASGDVADEKLRALGLLDD